MPLPTLNCRDHILAINLDLEFWMHPILYSTVAWMASRHDTASVCVVLLQHPPTPLCLDLSSSHSPFSPPMTTGRSHTCIPASRLRGCPLSVDVRLSYTIYNPRHCHQLARAGSTPLLLPSMGPFSCSSPSKMWSMKAEAAMAGEQTDVSWILVGQRNLHSIQLQVWGLSPTFPIGWRPHP